MSELSAVDKLRGLHYITTDLSIKRLIQAKRPIYTTAKARKLSRIEALKRRPTKRPDWNELMKEIEGVRSGHIRLKKIISNDRSKPVLSKVKDREGQVSDKVNKNKVGRHIEFCFFCWCTGSQCYKHFCRNSNCQKLLHGKPNVGY